MDRLLLTITAICALGFAYLASSLALGAAGTLLLAVPVLLVWSVPVFYWSGRRGSHSAVDELWQASAYVSVGWLNFLLVLTLLRDLARGVAWLVPGPDALERLLTRMNGPVIVVAAFIALGIGMLVALRGPRVREVDIPIENLAPGLHGVRIVQISDLHVGPTIGRRYVSRVVRKANELAADIVAVTGDMVDGPVLRLAPHIAPLAQLQPADRVYFATGNHDYYAGAQAWIPHFRALGMRVLLNESIALERQGARLLIGGVVDPAARLADPHARPDAVAAAGPGQRADLRLLLAHNPSLAAIAEPAGFDVQLSGHTHAGQFFPWTLAVRLVHAPHVSGLSRRGRMWVYVNSGTGSWGPPVRFGSEPELTLLRLVDANTSAHT